MSTQCHCRKPLDTDSASRPTITNPDAIASLLSRAALVFPSPSSPFSSSGCSSFQLSSKEQAIKRINIATGEHSSHTLYCRELQRESGEVLVQGEWANTEVGAETSVENVLEALEIGYRGETPVRAVDVKAFWRGCSVCRCVRQAY